MYFEDQIFKVFTDQNVFFHFLRSKIELITNKCN